MESFELDPPELTDGVVVLRRMTEELLPEVLSSFELEPELDVLMGFDEAPSEEKLREWLPLRDNGTWLGILEPGTGRYLGDIAAHHIDWSNRRAELGFYTLLSERGQGICTRAVRLLTTWLLDQGFVRVQINTLPHNKPVHAVASKAGFQREGLLRSYFVERGKPVDAVLFAAIASEWTR